MAGGAWLLAYVQWYALHQSLRLNTETPVRLTHLARPYGAALAETPGYSDVWRLSFVLATNDGAGLFGDGTELVLEILGAAWFLAWLVVWISIIVYVGVIASGYRARRARSPRETSGMMAFVQVLVPLLAWTLLFVYGLITRVPVVDVLAFYVAVATLSGWTVAWLGLMLLTWWWGGRIGRSWAQARRQGMEHRIAGTVILSVLGWGSMLRIYHLARGADVLDWVNPTERPVFWLTLPLVTLISWPWIVEHLGLMLMAAKGQNGSTMRHVLAGELDARHNTDATTELPLTSPEHQCIDAIAMLRDDETFADDWIAVITGDAHGKHYLTVFQRPLALDSSGKQAPTAVAQPQEILHGERVNAICDVTLRRGIPKHSAYALPTRGSGGHRHPSPYGEPRYTLTIAWQASEDVPSMRKKHREAVRRTAYTLDWHGNVCDRPYLLPVIEFGFRSGSFLLAPDRDDDDTVWGVVYVPASGRHHQKPWRLWHERAVALIGWNIHEDEPEAASIRVFAPGNQLQYRIVLDSRKVKDASLTPTGSTRLLLYDQGDYGKLVAVAADRFAVLSYYRFRKSGVLYDLSPDSRQINQGPQKPILAIDRQGALLFFDIGTHRLERTRL